MLSSEKNKEVVSNETMVPVVSVTASALISEDFVNGEVDTMVAG